LSLKVCQYCERQELTPELQALLKPGEQAPKLAYLANHTVPPGPDAIKWALEVLKDKQNSKIYGPENAFLLGDSFLEFYDKSRRPIGPIRVSVFLGTHSHIIVVTDTVENKGTSVTNSFESIANHIKNNLYKGLLGECNPSEILWIERHTPNEPSSYARTLGRVTLELVEMTTGRAWNSLSSRRDQVHFSSPNWTEIPVHSPLYAQFARFPELGSRGNVPAQIDFNER